MRTSSSLTSALIGALLCIAGCSSVNSKLAEIPKSVAVPNASTTASPQPKPLGDPTGQSLAIALETAKLAEQRGMDQQAIQAYLSVRRQQPDHAGVAHALAVLYDRGGRVDDAAQEYRRALQENPDDADLRCDHGYFLYSTGKLEEAGNSYRRALELDPQHHQTKVNLAVLEAHRGNHEASMRLFTEAIGPAAARHNVGMIRLQNGDRKEAAELLAAAAKLDPSVAEKSTTVLAALQSKTALAGKTSHKSDAVRPAGFLPNESYPSTLNAN